MKIQAVEHDGCFSVDLIAENLTEAALLTRMGMNGTKQLRHNSSYVGGDGTFMHSLVIKKHGRADSTVPTRS